jgi:hypothetical protein|tara:strand:- start:1679 stop:1807 length:129 start_codon:yes stop_codon:yes gene_type:complete
MFAAGGQDILHLNAAFLSPQWQSPGRLRVSRHPMMSLFQQAM